MNNLFRDIVKVVGFSDYGVLSFFYAIYLKVTKKLPYYEERVISEEKKEKIIKIQILFYLVCAIIFVSLFVCLNLTMGNRTFIYCVHLIAFVIALIFFSFKKASLFE